MLALLLRLYIVRHTVDGFDIKYNSCSSEQTIAVALKKGGENAALF